MEKQIQKIDAGSIFSKLNDSESKYIFENRLEYNLNSDTELIYNLAIRFDDTDLKSLYSMIRNRDDYRNSIIVLFGAGEIGDYCRIMIKAYGIGRDLFFCDNNSSKQGKCFRNVPVISVEEAVNRLPEAVYIIASDRFEEQMKEQLLNLGVSEKSIYSRICNEKIFGIQYLDPEIISSTKDGAFVDGGCFNLRDTLNYLNYRKKCTSVYAFEPDTKNYEVCKANMSKVDSKVNIHLLPMGLWKNSEQLRFTQNGGSSALTESGTVTVEVAAIDDIVPENEDVAMIKMDIEGAELMALEGAKETIKRCKPDLAICIYHKKEDIVDIPKYVLELVPEYSLYIRHYSAYEWETVLYAVYEK